MVEYNWKDVDFLYYWTVIGPFLTFFYTMKEKFQKK